jgi:uncharacterized protein (DUF433 family)
MNYAINLSERTFKLLAERAEQSHRPPGELAEEVLTQYLSPPHAHIELIQTRSGLRAMLKGTRIPVGMIVNYLQVGETPETLTKEVMPHVTLAAIYDALSYYYDHKDEIDQERAANTEEAAQRYLRERLGEEGYQRLTRSAK